ncbi:hypothetical protein P3H15_27690 [Rhodococcus sp. T2V]|uniref:hypothetical protein n=1 Tax=Rhodococcus sp. T2V TaxID=3034164 RepID=UPI0023E0EF88|nr:hypothetical protein [Rhodococcus sp. T2V]MDF3308805.1 hypothetical protein [Rhodococcus sp. T2V]
MDGDLYCTGSAVENERSRRVMPWLDIGVRGHPPHLKELVKGCDADAIGTPVDEQESLDSNWHHIGRLGR